MNARLGGLLLVLGAVALAIQFIRVKRTNPEARQLVTAPPEVLNALHRACFDCHSDETRWPWYSRIAPLSWIVVAHVERGRQELNFSVWASYYSGTRRRKLEWIGRALRQRTMPPWWYRMTHPGARLDQTDYALLEHWVDSGLAAPQ